MPSFFDTCCYNMFCMKALYLCSNKTGIKKSEKKINFIFDSLRKIYEDLTIVKTENIEDFEENIRKSVGIFDVVIVGGGDGTLKAAVTVLMEFSKEVRPVLGYLPLGTVNDAGKAVGINGSLKKAFKILEKNSVVEVDVCKVNNEYFNFVCAAGAYSDISYVTKRKAKKFFGKFAYYFVAIASLFKKKKLTVHVEADDKIIDIKTPLVLIMNSKNVGGFPVNFNYSVVDGKVEIYLTKPGLFNGLLHYLFFKMRTIKLKASHVKVSIVSNETWCLDGEKGFDGDVEITVIKQELRMIGKL